MPLREFTCTGCNHRFEEIVSGDESVECPRCGGRKLNRLLSTFAVSGGSTGSSRMSSGDCDSAGGCGNCGDPRGPGACNWN